jgi:Flp pilus assembly protein TadD
MSREVGSFTSEAAALVALGSVERRLGSSEDARRHYEQALQVTAAISQPTMRANALLRLIELTAETGDVGSRREYAQEALLLAQTSLAGDAELALQVAGALADEGGDQ